MNDEARAVARVLVFSGHRIDAPGRKSPRFPRGAAQQAAELIGAAVRHEQNLAVGAPVVGYGFAWYSHFKFEKNKPATFRHPVYSLMGDWAMFVDILRGRVRI